MACREEITLIVDEGDDADSFYADLFEKLGIQARAIEPGVWRLDVDGSSP